MTNVINVALLQMDVALGDPEANYRKLERMLEEAVAKKPKPDAILFPEMWNTGYALDRIHDLADRQGVRTKELLSAFARRHGVHLVGGSIADKTGNDVRNTTYVFDRAGHVAAEYSKIHLFCLMDEEKYLASGSRIGLFEFENAKAGAMICYDIRFPELARKIAVAGAKLLFVPAEWPHPRLHHWRSLLIARAIENQMYVVACNRVGTSGDTSFFGHSLVIDPWGEVLAEAGEEEAILTAAVDLDSVDDIRRQIPVFTDRRPNLY